MAIISHIDADITRDDEVVLKAVNMESHKPVSDARFGKIRVAGM